jgi:hypothetical protein
MLTNRRLARQILREWFCGLVSYSLLIAPFGCQLQAGGDGDGDGSGGGGLLGGVLGDSTTGLFINEDLASNLLMAARNGDGNAFYVFGTRDADGNLEEIETISVASAAGETSFVAFESGRPMHAQGPNGSYAHVTYDVVTPERLAGAVELYDAATASKSSYPVDIDLAQAAAEIATRIAEVTGRTLDTSGLSAGGGGKTLRESVRVTIFSPFYTYFVLPLVTTIGLMTIALGQIVIAMFAAVTIALQAVVLAVFSPFFLIAELLGDVVFRVQLTPLVDIFDFLPPPPVIVLV